MKEINRILCCCMTGMGSSFLVAMNVKKVMESLGMEDVLVDHAGTYDAGPGAADLFVCSADIYEECSRAGDAIPLEHLTDYEEVETKIKAYLNS